jgi:hypothetical protein
MWPPCIAAFCAAVPYVVTLYGTFYMAVLCVAALGTHTGVPLRPIHSPCCHPPSGDSIVPLTPSSGLA